MSQTSLSRFLKRMSLPAVTKHLKVLEAASLITKGRNAQWRPCTLNTERLRDAVDWMEQHRIAWEETLDRLDAHMKIKTNGKRNGRNEK
jgi:DNA-binding transcriptional ArsR family regulator